MNMRMEQRLMPRMDQRLTQKQLLSQKILQSLKLLHLSAPELESAISQEIENNPALSVERDVSGRLDDPQAAAQPRAETRLERQLAEIDRLLGEKGLNPEAASVARDDGLAIDTRGEATDPLRWEQDLEFIERTTDDGPIASRSDLSAAAASGDDDFDPMEAVAGRGTSLEEHVLSQLEFMELEPKLHGACVRIVQALNGDGHLAVPLDQIIPHFPGTEEEDFALDALAVVQSLDPAGIGARSTAEALLLQIRPNDPDFPLYSAILNNHWDDLLHRRFAAIARALSRPLDDVTFAVEQFKSLDPYPGRAFDHTPSARVVPELAFEPDSDLQGEYRVRLLRDRMPPLRLRPSYLNVMRRALKDPNTSADDRKYMTEKVMRAREFIESLKLRESTLERVAKAILARQKEFMEIGVGGLKPLKQEDIAGDTGVAVSTVSRTVAEKYAETPWGVMPLKAFFTGATATSGGDDTSPSAVKEQLRSLLENEDKKNPLSDAALMQILKDKYGIQIERRTVMKYREALGFANSRMRKAG